VRLVVAIAAVLVLVIALGRCRRSAETEGRERARNASRLFRAGAYIEAVAEYEQALALVDDTWIHFNLGLAYAKLFQPGLERPLRLGVVGSAVCDAIPHIVTLDARVCLAEGDRTFDDCDDDHRCSASHTCTKTRLCALASAQVIARAAATHFQIWLAANDDDHETRRLMTVLWIDSHQFREAIEYWKSRNRTAPGDAETMKTLASISIKAGDWRAAIAWYRKLASVARDDGARVAAYELVGQVAWSQLSSSTVPATDRRELADRGIAALQRAIKLAPTNGKLVRLQGSLYNLRALTRASPADAENDRAIAQRLLTIARGLR
jgi:tetratricopeptide (TPR) repeat protein